MADFVQKSERNEEAVGVLNKSSFYDQAIHCSYYACLQFIMYFNIKTGIDEASTKQAVAESKKRGLGSNVAYINLMLGFLSRKTPHLFKKVSRDVNKLKILRTEADYSEKMLSRTESEEASRLAKNVKLELKEVIKI
jgi:hypothetical protein